jgi:hypothetical protein
LSSDVELEGIAFLLSINDNPEQKKEKLKKKISMINDKRGSTRLRHFFQIPSTPAMPIYNLVFPPSSFYVQASLAMIEEWNSADLLSYVLCQFFQPKALQERNQ